MAREVPKDRPPPAPDGVRISRAVAGDEALLGEINGRAWGRADYGEATRAWAARILRGEAGEVACWIAWLDGEPAGTAVLRFLPGLGYMQGAAVIPGARGRGIYRTLTRARLATLHARGIGRAVIWAHAETSAPIVRRMGFVEVTHAVFHEWRPGEAPHRAP